MGIINGHATACPKYYPIQLQQLDGRDIEKKIHMFNDVQCIGETKRLNKPTFHILGSLCNLELTQILNISYKNCSLSPSDTD